MGTSSASRCCAIPRSFPARRQSIRPWFAPCISFHGERHYSGLYRVAPYCRSTPASTYSFTAYRFVYSCSFLSVERCLCCCGFSAQQRHRSRRFERCQYLGQAIGACMPRRLRVLQARHGSCSDMDVGEILRLGGNHSVASAGASQGARQWNAVHTHSASRRVLSRVHGLRGAQLKSSCSDWNQLIP